MRPVTTSAADRIATYHAASGVPVYVLRLPGYPTASILVFVSIGSRHEAPFERGMSHLLEHLVMEAPVTPGGDSVTRVIESLGGEANAFTSREHCGYYARVPAARAVEALESIVDAVAGDRDFGAVFERERAVVKEELRASAVDPADLVQDAFFETASEGHPLAASPGGSVSDADNITLDAISEFRGRHLHGGSVAVVVVGNVDATKVVRIVERGRLASLFPGLPDSNDRSVPGTGPSRRIVRDVDSGTAYLALGGIGAGYADPDRAAFDVVATAIGGASGSLLFEELRAKRAWTYDVYAVHTAYRDVGALRVRLGTDKSLIDDVFDLVRDLLGRAASTLSAKSVDRARRVAAGQVALACENSIELAILIAQNRFIGGLDQWTPGGHTAEIDRVGEDDVIGAIDKTLARGWIEAVARPIDGTER